MTSIPRRGILKGAGVLGGILLAPKLPMWSLAEAAPSARAPASFTDLSSTLLGIAPTVINPTVKPDDISLSDVYYDLGNIAGAAAMNALIAEYDRLVGSSNPPSVIARVLLTEAGGTLRPDAIGTFARLTMLMWLYGVWYGGTEVSRNPQAPTYITDANYRVDFIVSSRAYKAGWIWRIAQSHPMGFSQFNFGSWASPPPTLADYGISLTQR